MEFGDIIYFILLVFFMILGFFNDSRKKKQQRKQTEAEPRPFFEEERESIPGRSQESRWPEKSRSAPPVPYSGKGVHREFRSSSDLVSIHDEQSSHPSYTFDYDADSFYEKDTDSPDVPENVRDEIAERSVHPLIKGLRGDASREELTKGLIYGEIIRRKY
ncbi:MAG: hypothetical protein LBB62_10035 [Proteiniphilum sp.]|nr:hypothetical protein [Proteiniphilum sp.]